MLYDSNNSTRYKDALANYDARKYHICAPHDGTKGLSFRRFANDFLTNIATFDLKDPNEIYDLSETLLGLDEGGSATPPGANAPIALPGTQAAARRRARRLKYAYVFLYQHNTDLSLRKMLMDEAHNDGDDNVA